MNDNLTLKYKYTKKPRVHMKKHMVNPTKNDNTRISQCD